MSPKVTSIKPAQAIKTAVFILCLLPALVLISSNLGANPIEKLTHTTGDWALRFLLITLCVSPLTRIAKLTWLMRLRRMLGLFAFTYATAHFSIYLILDQGLAFGLILEDIAERPYITIGFAALLLMTPLALTSTNNMVKRLGGKRWKTLHKLVYPCAILGVAHFIWLVKADAREPLIYAFLLAILLLLRIQPGKRLLQATPKRATNS